MKTIKNILILVFCSFTVYSQDLNLWPTRDWIRLNLQSVEMPAKVYLAKEDQTKPTEQLILLAPGQTPFYITDLEPETKYKVWVDLIKDDKVYKTLTGEAYTTTQWALDPEEVEELKNNPSSAAVPEGMELVWQDEFNDLHLNKNKWTDNYFSTLNYFNETNHKEMLEGRLPRPGIKFNGEHITIFINDSIPERIYMPGGSQKISSIQTYDWQTGENRLDNSRGGYFEVRVNRSKKGNPKGLNTAFWFDSPGPDLRYYLEQGTVLDGVKGIRPKGQLFEIDVFEYIHAQFVLHGHVNEKGEFQRNLNTHIAEGFQHEDNWLTHGVSWSPTSVKHFIDGQLIKEYTDKNQLYSPNHFMNVFLGSYGSEGEVNMDVDYIRYYNYPLLNGNELPNPDFNKQLAPWESTGTLAKGRKGTQGILLEPGQNLEQYVYLENNQNYKLNYWVKGRSNLEVQIDNVTLVNGELSPIFKNSRKHKRRFKNHTKTFKTGEEIADHKKIIRVFFENNGNSKIYLDDITIKQK